MTVTNQAKRLSIAPMMGWTNRHFRAWMRMISPDFPLMTEMVVADKMIKHQHFRELDYADNQHPIACQLGGSDPYVLATCAQIAHKLGFDEVNLNVGCPSKKVRSGKMGAVLMKEASLVADCLKAMQEASPCPVSIKTRLGVDDLDDDEFFHDFIAKVTDNSGCDRVVVHARKALLQGLSAKENRHIPPLNRDRVRRVKPLFKHIHWTINGGVKSLTDVIEALGSFEGVMLGRVAYENPLVLIQCQAYLSKQPEPDLKDLLASYLEYAKTQVKDHRCTQSLVMKPFLRLYTQNYHGKTWHQWVELIFTVSESEAIRRLVKLINSVACAEVKS